MSATNPAQAPADSKRSDFCMDVPLLLWIGLAAEEIVRILSSQREGLSIQDEVQFRVQDTREVRDDLQDERMNRRKPTTRHTAKGVVVKREILEDLRRLYRGLVTEQGKPYTWEIL